MDNLPVEIVERIGAYLDYNQILYLRLACRYFAEIFQFKYKEYGTISAGRLFHKVSGLLGTTPSNMIVRYFNINKYSVSVKVRVYDEIYMLTGRMIYGRRYRNFKLFNIWECKSVSGFCRWMTTDFSKIKDYDSFIKNRHFKSHITKHDALVYTDIPPKIGCVCYMYVPHIDCSFILRSKSDTIEKTLLGICCNINNKDNYRKGLYGKELINRQFLIIYSISNPDKRLVSVGELVNWGTYIIRMEMNQ